MLRNMALFITGSANVGLCIAYGILCGLGSMAFSNAFICVAGAASVAICCFSTRSALERIEDRPTYTTTFVYKGKRK